jgi:DeoR/GlpR family transcriptional regulator of sugar metabolism
MTATRRQKIESLLQSQGGCSVESLSRECGVSDMTIRRDLAALARKGKVLRTHGGALPGERVLFEFEFLARVRENEAAKRQIAARGAALIPDGSVVLMDSGTTTLALAGELQLHHNLTVITTSLPIAAALQTAGGVRVLLLGGFVRKDAPDLGGAITEANLETIHADLAFIGADGIDLEGKIYNANPEVARMLVKMAAAAGRVYGVSDHTKIGRKAMIRFGDAAKWAGLIVDAGLPAPHRKALTKAGVNLLLADQSIPSTQEP